MWLCVEPNRIEKTERIMNALANGGLGDICIGVPPDNGEFLLWGHRWTAEKIVPGAIAEGRPWWLVDNGYWKPANGRSEGYHAITYRGTAPVQLPAPDMDRLNVEFHDWRPVSHGYVLLCLPGEAHGRMMGLDMSEWVAGIKRRVAKRTDRRIMVRDKRSRRPLVHDLNGAWCVVTHSSKVAVEAVRCGTPAIVAETNPAAPMCSTDLDDIENPPMPEGRELWWASLMCQQFDLSEMRNGYAREWMQRVRRHYDTISGKP